VSGSQGPLERAHEHARACEPGRLYGLVRAIAAVVLRAWFRLRVTGSEHVPEHGAAIVAANHKSFLDAFFIGLATPRRVRFMAKAELFRGPLASLLPRLGAFPVRRGEADPSALMTARTILGEGGALVVFPEGTRVDEPDALGSPHHGAGRLALDRGAPIVPTAITGTSHLWLGPLPKPRRVQVSFLAPVSTADPQEAIDIRERLEGLIDERVWPAVQAEYGRLYAAPGLVALGLAVLGLGGLAARRSGAPARLLGVVEPRKLRRRSRRRALLDRLHRG
jgi:1-acyl-sn-glycerol-3-phosphate acyltransferase